MDQHQRLLEDLYSELGDLKRILMGSRDQLLGELQLTRSQIEVILVLCDKDEQTVGEIAGCLAVTHSASTQTIETLVKRGLVERVPDERDRRIVRSRLTTEGRALAATIKDARHERLGRALGDLSNEELAQVKNVVRKLVDQFDTRPPKPTVTGDHRAL